MHFLKPLSTGIVPSKSLLPRASDPVKHLSQPKHKLSTLVFLLPSILVNFALSSVAYTLQSFSPTALCAALQQPRLPGCKHYVTINVLCVSLRISKAVLMSTLYISLCFAVIVALPAATPKEYKNTASYALGNFTNRTSSPVLNVVQMNCLIPCIVDGWPNGFAFIMSFMAPLWTICAYMQTCFGVVSDADYPQVRSTLLCISARKPRTLPSLSHGQSYVPRPLLPTRL